MRGSKFVEEKKMIYIQNGTKKYALYFKYTPVVKFAYTRLDVNTEQEYKI